MYTQAFTHMLTYTHTCTCTHAIATYANAHTCNLLIRCTHMSHAYNIYNCIYAIHSHTHTTHIHRAHTHTHKTYPTHVDDGRKALWRMWTKKSIKRRASRYFPSKIVPGTQLLLFILLRSDVLAMSHTKWQRTAMCNLPTSSWMTPFMPNPVHSM